MKRKRLLPVAVLLAILAAFLLVPRNAPQNSPDVDAPGKIKTAEQLSGLRFPQALPESGLVVEDLVCYNGTYYEDGTATEVSDVAGLVISNPGERMVRFAAVALEQDGKQLYFFVYCLPPGGRCLVAEKSRQAYAQTAVTDCRTLKIQWIRQDLRSEEICYVGFGENLTVVNHGDQQQDITVWYKHYNSEEDCYLGGVAYSVHYLAVSTEEQRSRQPQYYCAGTAKVVLIE